jgi:hypothetical protein
VRRIRPCCYAHTVANPSQSRALALACTRTIRTVRRLALETQRKAEEKRLESLRQQRLKKQSMLAQQKRVCLVCTPPPRAARCATVTAALPPIPSYTALAIVSLAHAVASILPRCRLTPAAAREGEV